MQRWWTAVIIVMSLMAPAAAAEVPLLVAQAQPQDEDASPDEEPPKPPQRRAAAPKSEIEEIVVVGTKSEASQDFSAGGSVTGFGASDLEALGAQSVEDLAAFTPNLEIVTTGATTPTFFIRGVGLNDFNANAATAVAVYQDDVALNSPGLQLGTLFDMEAVNVLRGPQGDGPARNASAGAIKLYTVKPSGDFGGYLRSQYGNFDFIDWEGAIEAPIYQDMLASRLAFRLTQRDGWMRNACGGLEEGQGCGENRVQNPVMPGLPKWVNNRDNWAARGTLLFEPTLDQRWLLGVHGSRRDEKSQLGQSYGTTGNIFDAQGNLIQTQFLGGADPQSWTKPEVRAMQTKRFNELLPIADCQPSCDNRERRAILGQARLDVADELARKLDTNPYKGYYDKVGPTTSDVWGGYLRGEVALPRGVALTYIGGYDTYDRRIDIDLDFSPNVLFEIDTKDKLWQFTQDVRLNGQIDTGIDGASPVNWDTGGYFLEEKLNVHIANDFGAQQRLLVANRDYVQRLWSGGVYGSFSWDFLKNFTLDGGVRYNIERKQMDYKITSGLTGFPRPDYAEETWRAPTGKIQLTYRFREDTQVYWKYSRGWKAGHFNATSSPSKGITPADPESIDAFETGVRGAWWGGRVSADLSFFYYNYDDYQLFTVENDYGSNPGFVIVNASDAEIYGGELDLITRPWWGAFANIRLSWLESQFLDFVQKQVIQGVAQGPGGIESVTYVKEINNTGNRLLNSPEFKISITVEQAIPLGQYGTLTPRYDGAWTDDTFFDATEGKGIPNIDNEQFLPSYGTGQKAYWLHNLRLGYQPRGGSWEIAGWVRNLTDEHYKNFAFDVSTFQHTTISFVGEPRTYGISASVHF